MALRARALPGLRAAWWDAGGARRVVWRWHRASPQAPVMYLRPGRSAFKGDVAMEYKAIPQTTTQIDGRTVTGIFAVHGNVDDGNDRTFPGLFDDFLVNGRGRARFLWQHDGQAPPTAAIENIRELSRDQLPAPILK